MALITHILLILLLAAGILTLGKLFAVLNGIQQAVVDLGTTRNKLDGTLQQANVLLKDVDDLAREDVKPTLAVARAALANIETTTRAAADTTTGLRNLIGAGPGESGQGMVVKLAVAAGARLAMRAATDLGKAAVRRLFHSRKKAPQEPAAKRRRRIAR